MSRSCAESEYRALANATAELLWLKALLSELRVSLSAPPLLLCDNVSTNQLAANPVMHARTKHVEIDYHFVRERVVSRCIDLQFTAWEDQLADALTKPLPSPRFLSLRSKLTVHRP